MTIIIVNKEKWRPRRDHRPRPLDLALAHSHPGADFGAQFVDQAQTLVGFDVPEGPAVAGARTLRHRADAVHRANLLAEHDGAVGTHQRAVTLFVADQSS